MTQPPLISVVMPVYNAAPFLKAAIASVLAQTFRDFELIVVDDGSCDGSGEIVRSIPDKRIALVSRAHRGLAETRNEGLSLARGDLVALMDADDISHPGRFERQVVFLNQHTDVAGVGTAMAFIDEQGDVTSPTTRWNPPVADMRIRVRMPSENCFANGSMMFRRHAAAGIQYHPNLTHAEDYDFWFRLLERCRLGNLPDVLYKRRLHRASAGVRAGRAGQVLAQMVRDLAAERLTNGIDRFGRHLGAVSKEKFDPQLAAMQARSLVAWSLNAAMNRRPVVAAGWAARTLTNSPSALPASIRAVVETFNEFGPRN